MLVKEAMGLNVLSFAKHHLMGIWPAIAMQLGMQFGDGNLIDFLGSGSSNFSVNGHKVLSYSCGGCVLYTL